MSLPVQSMRLCLRPVHSLRDLRVRDRRDEVAYKPFASLVLNSRRDRYNALVRHSAVSVS